MTEDKFKQFEKEEGLSLREKMTIISAKRKELNFIDYLFMLIIPHDNDIVYPNKTEWDNLIKKIMMRV